jgi:membrane-associated protein
MSLARPADSEAWSRTVAAGTESVMDWIRQALDIFLHLDKHLNGLAGQMGAWLDGLLFMILFCETGLVVTPFLPGDSLLFAVGALAAKADSPIHLPVTAVLMCVAAVLGDAVNFSIGKWVGPAIFHKDTGRLLNKQHLLRAQRFYETHGGKTIFLARFIPIIRTFAPFVAGIGKMDYLRFAVFNVTGGVTWVLAFLLAGYKLGEKFKDSFHWVIVAIIVISVVPVVIEYIRARRDVQAEAVAARQEQLPSK